MTLLQTLQAHLKKRTGGTKEEAPQGLCPNCWGRQEYGGNFYKAAKNYKADINTKNPKLGWVQEYAEKHLKGIQLQKENDKLVCQKCKITYRAS